MDAAVGQSARDAAPSRHAGDKGQRRDASNERIRIHALGASIDPSLRAECTEFGWYSKRAERVARLSYRLDSESTKALFRGLAAGN